MLRVLLLFFLVFSFGYAVEHIDCSLFPDRPKFVKGDSFVSYSSYPNSSQSCVENENVFVQSIFSILYRENICLEAPDNRYYSKSVDTIESCTFCDNNQTTEGNDTTGYSCVDTCSQPDVPYPPDENNATYTVSDGNGDCELNGGFTESSSVSCNTNYRCKFPDENSTQCPSLDENGTCVPVSNPDANNTDENSTRDPDDWDGDGIPNSSDTTPLGAGGDDENNTCKVEDEDIPFPPKDETKYTYTTENLSLCNEQNGTLYTSIVDCKSENICEKPIGSCDNPPLYDNLPFHSLTSTSAECDTIAGAKTHKSISFSTCTPSNACYIEASNEEAQCELILYKSWDTYTSSCSCDNGFVDDGLGGCKCTDSAYTPNSAGVCILTETNTTNPIDENISECSDSTKHWDSFATPPSCVCNSGMVATGSDSCRCSTDGYIPNDDGICSLDTQTCPKPHQHSFTTEYMFGLPVNPTCLCDVGYKMNDADDCIAIDSNSTCQYPPLVLDAPFQVVLETVLDCEKYYAEENGTNIQTFPCPDGLTPCYFNNHVPDQECYYLDERMGLAFKTLVSSLTECNTLSGSLPYSVYEAVKCEKPYACYYGDVNNTTPPTTDNNTTTGGTLDSNTTPPTTDNNTTDPTDTNDTENYEIEDKTSDIVDKGSEFSNAIMSKIENYVPVLNITAPQGNCADFTFTIPLTKKTYTIEIKKHIDKLSVIGLLLYFLMIFSAVVIVLATK